MAERAALRHENIKSIKALVSQCLFSESSLSNKCRAQFFSIGRELETIC